MNAALFSLLHFCNSASAFSNEPNFLCGTYKVQGILGLNNLRQYVLTLQAHTSSPSELLVFGGNAADKLARQGRLVALIVYVSQRITAQSIPAVLFQHWVAPSLNGGEDKAFNVGFCLISSEGSLLIRAAKRGFSARFWSLGWFGARFFDFSLVIVVSEAGEFGTFIEPRNRNVSQIRIDKTIACPLAAPVASLSELKIDLIKIKRGFMTRNRALTTHKTNLSDWKGEPRVRQIEFDGNIVELELIN